MADGAIGPRRLGTPAALARDVRRRVAIRRRPPAAPRESVLDAQRRLAAVPSPTLGPTGEPVVASVGVVLVAGDDTAALEALLRGVTAQRYPHWHCVVVDDASRQDILGVVRPVWNADRRVRLLRHAARRGRAAAWNTGLRALSTDLVM